MMQFVNILHILKKIIITDKKKKILSINEKQKEDASYRFFFL